MMKEVFAVSEIAPKRSLKDILCKTMEELGEVSTMINKPDKQHDETLTHEIADTIQCLLDLQWAYTRQILPDTMEDRTVSLAAESDLRIALKHKNFKWKELYCKED